MVDTSDGASKRVPNEEPTDGERDCEAGSVTTAEKRAR
jgi:hypothetical protein